MKSTVKYEPIVSRRENNAGVADRMKPIQCSWMLNANTGQIGNYEERVVSELEGGQLWRKHQCDKLIFCNVNVSNHILPLV